LGILEGRRKPVVLVTGANGEIGHGLIPMFYHNQEGLGILALDLKEIEPSLRNHCQACIVGDILDQRLLDRLVSEYEIYAIFHLAAMLSTRSEFTPETAHLVNVQGTLNLLRLAVEQSRWHGRTVKFLFPSSIAVYGLSGEHTKLHVGKIKEHQWNEPTTMYGCNKLYCEHLGRYYTRHYRQLALDGETRGIDFRCIRFPGLISAVTEPSGGTSDYAPEMLHHAAQGKPYVCFVREDVQIPLMTMPDAIKALIMLMDAPISKLSRLVYNVSSFNPTAGEIRDLVMKAFLEAKIRFEPDERRQAIVDSWPSDVDDTPARQDWAWLPDYDFQRAFDEYLVPLISQRHNS